MIEYEVVKPMWKSNKKDLIPTFATFVLCLGVGVEMGILIGVLINIVFLLYPSARPKLTVDTQKVRINVKSLFRFSNVVLVKQWKGIPAGNTC